MAKETKETEIKILLTTDGKQTQATLKLTDDQVIKLKNSLKSLGGVDSQMKGFVTTLKSVAGAMGLAFGANEIFSFMKQSVAEIQKQEQVTRELKATLDSTGFAAGLTSQEILDLANNLEELNRFAFDDKDIVDASGLLLTFTKINREIFPQTMQLALDLSTRFKQDLKSSIVQIGKALNDPIAGVTALSRVGVQFTDGQKALIKSLVEENRLLEAQTIILDELSIQVSGSAAGSITDFDLKVRQLNEALEQLHKLVGEGLTESFSTLPIFLKEVELNLGGILQIAYNLNELLLNSQFRGFINSLTDPKEYIRFAKNKATQEVQGKDKADVQKMANDTEAMINAITKLGVLSADDSNTLAQLRAKLAVYQSTLATMIAIEKEKNKDKKKKPEQPEIINLLDGETEDIILGNARIGGRGIQQGATDKNIQSTFGTSAWQSAFSSIGTNSLTAGVNSFWDNFIVRSRQAKDEWDAVWLSIRNSALNALGDIISDQAWTVIFDFITSLIPGGGFISSAGNSAASIAQPSSAISKISGGSSSHNLESMLESKLDKFVQVLDGKQWRLKGEDIVTSTNLVQQRKADNSL